MDASLLEKQQYLSKEILEGGFDPEDFQDFMVEHSDRDLDLNSWTLAELTNIVEKFKNKAIGESHRDNESVYMDGAVTSRTDKS